MVLEEKLRALERTLKDYGLKDARFSHELIYCHATNIPGLCLRFANSKQVEDFDKLQELLQIKVMSGLGEDAEVTCYSVRFSGVENPDTYREIHVRIKKGNEDEILETLADNLDRYLGILKLGAYLSKHQTKNGAKRKSV